MKLIGFFLDFSWSDEEILYWFMLATPLHIQKQSFMLPLNLLFAWAMTSLIDFYIFYYVNNCIIKFSTQAPIEMWRVSIPKKHNLIKMHCFIGNTRPIVNTTICSHKMIKMPLIIKFDPKLLTTDCYPLSIDHYLFQQEVEMGRWSIMKVYCRRDKFLS